MPMTPRLTVPPLESRRRLIAFSTCTVRDTSATTTVYPIMITLSSPFVQPSQPDTIRVEHDADSDPCIATLKSVLPDFNAAVMHMDVCLSVAPTDPSDSLTILESVDNDEDRALDVLLGMNDPTYISSAAPLLLNHNRTRLNKILTNSLPVVLHSKKNKLQGLGQQTDSLGGTINSKLGIRHTNPVVEVVMAGVLAVGEAGAVHESDRTIAGTGWTVRYHGRVSRRLQYDHRM